MKTIILGKEGNQPFPIKADGVSRLHAKITINDMGEWMLEDQDSTNGTYVRDEKNGEMHRVVKLKITPMTFVCMGPDNAKGCCFYARQVLKENYGNFISEYEYLNEREDEYDENLEQIEDNAKKLNVIKAVLPVLLFALSFAVFPGMGPISWIIRGAGAAVPTVLILLFYNPIEIKKRHQALREKIHHCPNPLCSHKLKTSEIREMKCGKCKK